MKRFILLLTVLIFTSPVLAKAPNKVNGSERNLVMELLDEYGSCTNAGKPEKGEPGYDSKSHAVVYVCKRDGHGAFGGMDSLTYEAVSYNDEGKVTGWIKLD